MRASWFKTTVLFFGFLTSSSVVSATAVEWDTKFFNPKPAQDDVVLPLPCGGAMVFRRVYVESTGPMSDTSVDLGSSEEEWGYAENTLTRYIAGSFSDVGSPMRHYLMGKYEVSQLQYKAVLDETCPKPTMKLRLPQNRVGWFDAVGFANKLTQWLIENASGQMPKEQDAIGFLRLPTETEWEYAARGGNEVSIADFRERTFSMPDGIERYVWFSGTRSSNGKMQLTGLLAPNALGIHDILGNVDEIVLDAFRLNHLDRLHGQSGGFTVRGGNYFTAKQDIRASQRDEVPHYGPEGPRRSKTTGFRLVVSTPVVVSSKRLTQIQGAWAALGSEKSGAGEPGAGISGAASDDPVQELALLSESTSDKNMKARLQNLGIVMRATMEARNRQRDAAARASLRMGGIICQQVGQDASVVRKRRNSLGRLCSPVDGGESIYSPEECDKMGKRFDVQESRYSRNIGVYADSIIEVARNYDDSVLMNQSTLLLDELKSSEGGRRLGEFVRVYSSQTQSYATNWLVKRDSWSEDCLKAYDVN